MSITHVPLHVIFPRKTLFTNKTGPIHVNSVKAKRKLTKSQMVLHNFVSLLLLLLLFHKFPSSSSSSSSTNFPLPPPPPQLSLLLLRNFISLLLLLLLPNFIVFITKPIKDGVVLALAHFITMSRVVRNNRGFLQILAECFPEQRQFLLMTASPQQMHALVQVIRNVLLKHTPVSEEERLKVIQFKDALVNLAEVDVPYKTKEQTLVQEGFGFIQDLLTPVLSSLGFLML